MYSNGHCLTETIRVPDGDDLLADAEFRGIAQRDGGQIRAADLDDSHIAGGVGANHGSRELPSVLQHNGDLCCAFDDVVVRQDVAVGCDDEAGT